MANIARVALDSKTEWPIKQVTVYEDRAQVTRILDHKVTDYGEVELKLENLPTFIVAASIRAEVESANATIYEVAHRDVTTTPPPYIQSDREKEIEKLKKELTEESDRAKKRIDWIKKYSDKSVPTYTGQNKDGKEKFEAVISEKNLSNFESFLGFYDDEMGKLDNRLIDIEEEKKTLEKERVEIQQKAQLANMAGVKHTREVSVLLNIPQELAEQKAPPLVTVKLLYVVHNAKWQANYDVRVVKVQNDVAISYYGKVTNSTGEDWNEVTLSLSTAKPSRPGNLRKLPRAEVRIKKAAVQKSHTQKKKIGGRRTVKKKLKKERSLASLADLDDSGSESSSFGEDDDLERLESRMSEFVGQDYTEAETKGGSAVFKLARLCTVESDGKTHKQTIGTVKLIPSFSYVVSPKVSPHCFLKCSTVNGSNYVFVPGAMAVFFNDSFVTTTKMGMVRQNESFSVYLGIEESVKVDYQPEVSKTANVAGGLLTKGKTKTETVSRVIKVTNTRSEDINCVIYEQVPLSNEKTIKVDILSPEIKKKTAKESYRINKFSHLEAKKLISRGKDWTLRFKYKIEWPKTKELAFKESLENMKV